MVGTAYAVAVEKRAAPRVLQPLRPSAGARVHAVATCRVLIANQQPIVRHGVRALLASEPDIEVVAETDSGSDAVRLVRRLRPDVVIVDLLLAGQGGIWATRMIRADVPETQVIVMTGVHEDAAAVEAIRAGAVAYLSKDACVEALLRAIRTASSGQVALPVSAVRLMRTLPRGGALSEREAEVLRLVASGLPNKQIARELSVSLSTVKAHVSSILTKLCLPTRTQLAVYAARTGLVPLERT
jgi:two-component system, NarL family, response regulator LiaR